MHPTPLSRCASATTNFNTSANKLTLFLHLFLRCPHIIVRELIGASSLKVENARRQTSGLQLFLHLHLHSHVFTKPLQFYLQVFLTQPWLFALFHLKCPSHLSPGLTEPSSKESGPPWARIRIHPLDGRRQLHHTNHLWSGVSWLGLFASSATAYDADVHVHHLAPASPLQASTLY